MKPQTMTRQGKTFLIGTAAACILAASCQKDEDEHSTGAGEVSTGKHHGGGSAQAAPPSPLADLRQAIQADRPMYELLEESHRLTQNLTPGQLAEIFAFMDGEPPEGMTDGVWRLLTNEIMEALRLNPLPELGGELYGLASSPRANPVVRDYAMQHYILCEEKVMRGGQDAAARTESLNRMLDNVGKLHSGTDTYTETLYGTSVLGLAAIAESDAAAGADSIRERMAGWITPWLDDSHEVSTANRIAAIQVAGRLKVEEAADLVAATVWDKSAPLLERISALYALNSFPAHMDEERLKKLAKEDRRLRHATLALLDKHSSPQGR